ncbi:MAG: DegT/DnrJ/EryC1/StrS family aminotransferase [Proteobacteria bacterium]|nr:MAG: DegT/DnrJ/EryC1/StrS family aminotransferase [Pseudomonadota bacterium]
MDKFLPFALPDIGEEEISAVVETLRSGWVTTGPKTKQFEQEFVQYLGGGLEAISVNSATAGLHLALEACGVSNGDQVIVPTLTFTATAEVIRYLGADPIFIDCDPNTLCIDIAQIEGKITQQTKAIMPVHMAGLACDMDAIIQIARKYNLRVIEDAAHSLPTKVNNVMIGQHDSDAIVYSFYATKTITTGEGGMVVTKDPELAKRCRVMRLHGISRDAFDRYTSNKPAWFYEIVAPGFKYNLTDIASSLGLSQLAKADRFQMRRQQMAERYLAELSDLPLILPPQVVNKESDLHAWHLFCCQLATDKISRDEFIQAMSELGIGTSVHFIPLHIQPYWKEYYNLKSEDFPNATKYYTNAFSLPLYTKMTDYDQTRVIAAIRKILA